MCKNGLGLFAQKWLLFLEIWWIKFLQNDKQHLLLKFFTKIFIFDWVIAIFMFFDEWWRHVLVHLKCDLKGLSIKQRTQFVLEGESPTLTHFGPVFCFYTPENIRKPLFFTSSPVSIPCQCFCLLKE